LARGLLVFALAAAAPAKTGNVTGQLIDLACYAQDQANTGNQHKNKGLICAQACAREGFPGRRSHQRRKGLSDNRQAGG